VIGYIVIAVLVVVLLLVGVANSRWAGRKGWVYNTHNPRPRGAGMPRLLDEIYQPGVEHVIEEEASQATRADHDDSGDTTDPG